MRPMAKRKTTFESLEPRLVMSASPGSESVPDHPTLAVSSALITSDDSPANPTSNSGQAQELANLRTWLSHYVLASEITPDSTSETPDATPEALALALRRMFLEATTHQADVGTSLWKLALADPSTPYWGYASSAVTFLSNAFDLLGIQHHQVHLWTGNQEGHVVLEYFSTVFGKDVMYDPLYGTLLLNAQGIPASLDDVLAEFSQHGLTFGNWSYRPTKLADYFNSETTSPADSRLSWFENRDYNQILRHYFAVVAKTGNPVVTEATDPWNPLPAKDRWVVFDQWPILADVTTAADDQMLASFLDTYALEGSGRYQIDLYHATRSTIGSDQPLDFALEDSFDAYASQLTRLRSEMALSNSYESWLPQYATSADQVAERVLQAQHSMFMLATAQYSATDSSLADTIAQAPGTQQWTDAEQAADFVVTVLRAFGVRATVVQLYALDGSPHFAVEYYSDAESRFVFYDPLYGVVLQDSSGRKASLDDIRSEIHLHGFDPMLWSFRPVSVGPATLVQAVDPQYAAVLARNYDDVLRSSFYFAALTNELHDQTVSVDTVRWTIYDESACSPLSDPASSQLIIASIQQQLSATDTPTSIQVVRATAIRQELRQSSLSVLDLWDATPTSIQVTQWMRRYVSEAEVRAHPTAIPELLALALRRMFLSATTPAEPSGTDLFALTMQQPDVASWSYAVSAVAFLQNAMQAFGIESHRVHLWNSLTAGHVLIEYESITVGQSVVYDPLYGVLFLNSDGRPASLQDLLIQFTAYGRDNSNWSYRPVRLYGYDESPTVVQPASTDYQWFENRDYWEVVRQYFWIVAVETDDAPLADASVGAAANRVPAWTVYNHLPLCSDVTASEENQIMAQFTQKYSSEVGGKYQIDLRRIASAESTPLGGAPGFETTAFAKYSRALEGTTSASADRATFTHWLAQYTDLSQVNLNSATAPELILRAMRTMYLTATQHVRDVGGDLFPLIQQDPTQRFWASCGSSSEFLLRAFQAFGVSVRRVSLYFTANDSHEMLEYYNSQYHKFVLYDPLYAVHLTDINGTPASIADVQQQIVRHQFNIAQWSILPQKPSPFAGTPAIAADPRYLEYDELDYKIIQQSYFNLIILRVEDYTWNMGFVTGSEVARGRWMVLDNLWMTTRLTTEERDAVWPTFSQAQGISATGRYLLTRYTSLP